MWARLLQAWSGSRDHRLRGPTDPAFALGRSYPRRPAKDVQRADTGTIAFAVSVHPVAAIGLATTEASERVLA